MVSKGKVLVCENTGVDVSEMASTALQAVASSEPLRTAIDAPALLGRWHCPADGAPTYSVEDGGLCTVCARLLPRALTYQLLEFNWHPG